MNETGETGEYQNNEMNGYPSNVKNDYYENNGYWNSETGVYQNNERYDSANYVSSAYQNNEKNDSLNL
jgi:hypothetical protein